jgi:hypothetical protein
MKLKALAVLLEDCLYIIRLAMHGLAVNLKLKPRKRRGFSRRGSGEEWSECIQKLLP